LQEGTRCVIPSYFCQASLYWFWIFDLSGTAILSSFATEVGAKRVEKSEGNLLGPERDSRFRQIVRGQLNFYIVSGHDPDEVLPHFSGNVSEHECSVLKLDPEHGPWEHFPNNSLRFDGFLFTHSLLTLSVSGCECNPEKDKSAQLACAFGHKSNSHAREKEVRAIV
jgi:hypothetical protein